MNDKSPRQHLSKKSGKSIKAKRADKRAKQRAEDASAIPQTTRKRRNNG